ncbi:ADP-ribosyl-[dinitrogen reductase] hydrolase [Sedimenticola sp.]|uniref:ADP-ribosyl-[dinitrogen reductase] hydrolase n=1 Tax=Sedimenticola sp. TaxID=1940285 RepID=UPI003D1090B8
MQTSLSLEQRAIGAYLGLAVGDALGATTEFLTPNEIRERYDVHNRIIGGGWLHLKPGQVTDDTGMSLALGESILEQGGVKAVPVARAFSDWMRGKPVDIGHTVRRGIVHFRDSGVPCVPENEFDAGNGACMRCLPVAIAYWNAPSAELVEASRIQSHVTHNNPQADAGTEAMLAMLVAAFRGEPLSTLHTIALNLVEQQRIYRFDRRAVENPSGWIVETLQVVFQAFFAHDNLESVLIDVVNRGGDADTTGAIAGMLAGACYGVEAIPRRWLKALDRQVRLACEQQALALLELARTAEWGRTGLACTDGDEDMPDPSTR